MTTTTQWILELIDKISSPMKSVTDASNEAGKSVDEVGVKAENAGKKLKDMKPVDIYAMSQSVQQLADDFNALLAPGAAFDAQMKDMSAITGVVGDQLDDLGDNARETGIKFGVDASDMVESYKGVLSRLGPEIAKDSEALEIMGEDVATLSKTMGNDAVGAMDALTTSALQFGVDLSNPAKAAQAMTTMMNIMAAGAKEGAAEVTGISAAIKVAGVEAYNSRVTFGETNAALQALAQGGKFGAEAGTALRNVIGKMAGIDVIPKDAQDKLKALGVNYDIVSNKALPFTTRLKELSKVQADATLTSQMFGVENASAANILFRSIDYQDQMKEKILGTTTATDQAEIVMSGYGETMNRVTAWFKDLGISFFAAGKYLGPMVTGLTSAVVVFANLANAKAGISMLFGTLKTMPFISSIVSGGFAGMSSAAASFGVAIMNIPIIGWIAAIVAGLIALSVYLYNTSESFRGFVTGIWEAVKTVFTKIWGFVSSVGQAIWYMLKGVFNPANWFDDNYNFSDAFKKIASASNQFGEEVGRAYGKGKEKGIAGFKKDHEKTAEEKQASGDLDITNDSPVLKPKDLGLSDSKALGNGGGGSSIKNITQKIEIKNYFSVDSSGGGDINGIAEKVVRAINDKLRDGIVAAS